MQQEITQHLTKLRRAKAWIALSLHPGIGNNTIRPEGNRLFINEGRDGKWDDVPEAFYDQLVDRFDSRYRK